MSRFNILTDTLPDTVTLFEKEYKVHTSFKNWLRIEKIISSYSEDEKKVAKALKLCYKEELPPNIVSSFLGMMVFLNRGTELAVPQGEKTEPLFSFSDDADIIYSAFYSKYGIDLNKEDMHWYKFCTLFSTLSLDNPFQSTLKIRTLDESNIKDPSKRRKIRMLKEKFKVKDVANRSEVDVAERLSTLF